MAVDYRLRYFFAITPVQDYAAWQGAQLLAARNHTPFYSSLAPMARYTPRELIDFFQALASDVSAIQPVGRSLAPEEDARLARFCFTLSLLEQVYRSGKPSQMLMVLPAPHTPADLLSLADEAWVADICQISGLFYRRHQHLLSKPFNLNPIFAGSADIGGADADLIVDGCLIDIKTTKQMSLDAEWLYQLVGYALLDYYDVLNIRSIGLYLSRQGELLTWSLDELLSILANDNAVSLQGLRGEFRAVVQHQLHATNRCL